MKFARSLLAVLALLVCAVPVFAQHTSGTPRDAEMTWNTLFMRSTSAAAAAQQPWIVKGSCQSCSPSGYADSSVWRRGATTATVYDTTRALRLTEIPWAPNFGNTAMNALTDSTYLPWAYLRVRQDTTSYSFAGTSGLDSVRVAAEVSLDGVQWFSCQGTNTQRFDVVYMTSGQDGLQSPTLIGVEASPGEDMAQFVLKCHPSTTVDNVRITNRSLCLYNGYVRFIIGMDASGQFAIDLGTWTSP
jgi:hypothetical protein